MVRKKRNCRRGAGCRSPYQPGGTDTKATPVAGVTADRCTGGAGGE